MIHNNSGKCQYPKKIYKGHKIRVSSSIVYGMNVVGKDHISRIMVVYSVLFVRIKYALKCDWVKIVIRKMVDRRLALTQLGNNDCRYICVAINSGI